MVTQITKGIKISVDTEFQGTYYKDTNLLYAFEYSISIENQSSDVVQLNSRHWVILDSLNNLRKNTLTMDNWYKKTKSKYKGGS